MGGFETSLLIGSLVPLLVGGAIVLFVLSTIKKRAGGSAIRSGFGLGPSAGDQQEVARLQTTGHRARAHLTGVRPTGVLINQINVGVELSFVLEPIDGSDRFNGTKNAVVSQAQMPRIGDVWPAWFDPADPTIFAVAMATQATAETIGLFREFGIPHPLDAMMGHPAPPPSPSPPPPAAPPPPGVDPVGELERLARLHQDGLLTAEEFADAKRRLLES